VRQEAGGKRQKEGARRSVFTNMRCSLNHLPLLAEPLLFKTAPA